jgi:hypothetical protein
MIPFKEADAMAEQALANKPQYQTPQIRVMTEQEILNSFQVTQAMATWWATC